MQCSPSFDWNWGNQNDPTACWYQQHLRFQVLQQGKCLRYPPERMGGVTKTTICMGGKGAAPPSNPHQQGDSPLENSPCTRYLGQRVAEKSSNCFSHFHGLVPHINYKDLEGFVMLGTHSEPRRGETSHICDISVPRVKYSIGSPVIIPECNFLLHNNFGDVSGQ